MKWFRRNKQRPCECGCRYEDHSRVGSVDGIFILYCKKCRHKNPATWCYNYRPIGNLEYLEWLSK
jgi:hypothetical protein